MTAPKRRRRLAASHGRRLLSLSLALGAAAQAGCGREFYRNWADQDVTEAVFEKSRDPRFRIDAYTVEPPALSRFADPYDPDRPPAPPDDHATEALSPTPQWAHFKLLTPQEGTGYLDMLRQWQAEMPPKDPRRALETGGPQESPRVGPEPAGALRPLPEPTTRPGPFPAEPPLPPANSGTTPPPLSPTPLVEPSTPSTPSITKPPGPPAAATPPTARLTFQDPSVLLTALQAMEVTRPQAPGTGRANDLPGRPGSLPVTPRIDVLPGLSDEDKPPRETVRNPGEARGEKGTAGFAAVLNPALPDFDEATAAGLPSGSNPYVINPAQALNLALMNNRPYQFHIETVYRQALAVTSARFQFQPQFYAGSSPSTAPSGGFAGNSGSPTSFAYRTRATGSQASTLSLGTVAGVSKVLSFGGTIAAGFANNVVFNFVGRTPRQPTVASTLPITFVQPFLRNGGRAVTLEGLTQAERLLIYEARNLARFRQQFIPYILTSAGQPVDNPGLTNDPNVGYLFVIQQLQDIENDRATVVAFERLSRIYKELVKGAASGISQLQVDQIDRSLRTTESQLVQDEAQYRIAIAQYRIQLGLPPDTPVILDRSLLASFNKVFREVNDWSARDDRDPEELLGIVAKLPTLEDIVVDGRPVLGSRDPEVLEGMILAAQRVALENRLDLMNNRAQLYDTWRQIAVTANALRGVFSVSVTNQILTPPTTTNPFAFVDQAKQFSLVLNTELPLVRLVQRNNFQLARFNYRQQQRQLQSQEDAIKLVVRTEIYNLIQFAQQYEINKVSLILNLRQKDNTQQAIIAPPTAGDVSNPAGGAANQAIQTQNLIGAQQAILGNLTSLIGFWINYQTQRLALYRDLGVIPYDEWEAFYELFPAATGDPRGDAAVGRN